MHNKKLLSTLIACTLLASVPMTAFADTTEDAAPSNADIAVTAATEETVTTAATEKAETDTVSTSGKTDKKDAQEGIETDIPEGRVELTINMPQGSTHPTLIKSDAIYPNQPYADDIEFTLTLPSGKVIKPDIVLNSDGQRCIKAVVAESELEGDIVLTLVDTREDYIQTTVDVSEYEYKLYDVANDKWGTSVTLKGSDFVGKIIESGAEADDPLSDYIRDNQRRVTSVNLDTVNSTLCSVLLTNIKDGWDPRPSNEELLSERDYYAITDVISASVYIDGEYYGPAFVAKDGVTTFNVPVTTDENGVLCCDGDITLEVRGFANSDTDLTYTATLNLGDWVQSPYSADMQIYCLQFDANFEYEDVADGDEDEVVIEDEDDMNEDDIIEINDYNAKLTAKINSQLTNCRFDLINTSNLNAAAVMGKVTDNYKYVNNMLKLSDKKVVNWGTLDLSQPKAEVSLDAGTYTIKHNDLLTVTSGKNAISEIAVKEGKNSVDLTVKPKYTVTINGLTDNFEFKYGGNTYKGSGSEIFMLAGNSNYLITDTATGKQYSVKATDEKPHLTVTLGSDKGAITTDTPGSWEDVPNTSDPIAPIMIGLGSITALFGGVAGVFFAKSKKNAKNK